MSLLDELCHLGVGLEVSKTHSRAILTLRVDQEVIKLSNTTPAPPCLPVCCHAPHHDELTF